MQKKHVDLVKVSENTKKLTALVVEDEREANRLLSNTFKKFFQEVHSAFSGDEGLDTYIKESPDVVFVDIVMKGIDGISLSRKIRELNPNQIIVIISASNDISKISETIEVGVNSFIQKPIDTNKILDLLNTITDLSNKKRKIETKTFSISLPLNIYDLVNDNARTESISKNAIIIRALRKFYEKELSRI
jgi:DNA-binding NtrC family response regulator